VGFGVPERRAEGDAQSLNAGLRGYLHIGYLAADAESIAGVIAANESEQQRAVLDFPGYGPDMGQCRRRRGRPNRDAAKMPLDSEQPRKAAGSAERSAAVGAERERRDPCRN